MRRLLFGLSGLLLIAAAPVDEAEKLMDAGQEKTAFELIEKAAAANDADAIDYLAWFYDEGRHVQKDHAKAARLYRRAAEAGQRHAQWRLGVMLDMGEGVIADPGEAIGWFRKAAAQGSSNALASLAVMYATGRGAPTDYAESKKYYLEAAKKHNPRGFYGVGALYSNAQGVARDATEACGWMMVAASLKDPDAKAAVEKGLCEQGNMAAGLARANQIAGEFGLKHRFKFEPKAAPKDAAKPITD